MKDKKSAPVVWAVVNGVEVHAAHGNDAVAVAKALLKKAKGAASIDLSINFVEGYEGVMTVTR